ncbi:starch synthase [Hypnocyclicus thermotrophus]|uniref:Glycogen synthase n=1 Tax=Hypnocyclicus thermotrophus TaxID=1627895 RepID=A0AA46DX36_9FUSO|nr:glycogen synthase GlgA [Hypnocyclicus thermotrophus]TDT67422.1 starch synthase [Hypnocyclicus thermotrophus]
MKHLKILFLSSELYPLIKTGGLADVAFALPKALKKRGHDIRVILPKYKLLNSKYISKAKFITKIEFKDEIFNILKIELEGLPIYLIENRAFFERDTLYENEDRDFQFAIYNEIALRFIKEINFKVNIIHCNDWHTGVLPYFLNTKFKNDKFYQNIKTVYSIHNLRFQGVFSSSIFNYLDYPTPNHEINFMKMGIKYADKINTVSKTYAEEIKTDFFGEGLNYELLAREKDLYGIVNGIDTDVFNPETDKHIYFNYNKKSFNKKYKNKEKLQKELKLPQNKDIPLIGIVSRLTSQKGLDLIECIIEELIQTENFQMVVLGTGESRYEELFLELRHKYPEKIATVIGYNAELANKIYAGSDMFLMPSLFEPCGLGQLIALRYGTIPIVRETGGLNDTVKAYNEFTGEGNGFSFTHYNAHDMMYTIRRAIKFYNDKKVWNTLVERALSGDYSWNASAKEYEDLYKSLI